MFNFNELAIVQPNEPNCYRGSFVGIRQDKYLGKMAFTVPKGFEDFEVNYENVKNLFFSMYRTFDKFLDTAKKNENLDDKPTGKDNAQIDNHSGAYIFIDEDNNETILYSKIDLIDSIFQLYKEMEIESLIQELGLVEDIDYSKIDRYLDKGVYLDNHAIFIENMVGYRNIVRGVPSELIELFCYIYTELANELKQELFESIKEISFNFSYKFLSPEQSLFSEYSFESTMNTLKDCLDNIHKMTAYKNGQYWNIYEAVEHFLYGSLEFDSNSNQGFWGINNFSYVWEEMCNYMVAVSKEYKILYCDTKLPLNQYKDNLSRQNRIWIDKDEIENVFHLDLHGHKRWIRPDIIVKPIIIGKHNKKSLNVAISKNILSINKKERKNSLQLGINKINFNGFVEIMSAGKQKPRNQKKPVKKIFTLKLVDDQQKALFEKMYQFFCENNKNSETGKEKFTVFLVEEKIIHIRLISESDFDELLKRFKYSYIFQGTIKGKSNEINYDDLYKKEESLEEQNIYIVDWKYYSHSIFITPNYRNDSRVNESIIKSLAYDFCLATIISEPIHSQFAIPHYNIEADDVVIDGKMLDCNIGLVRMNFLKIQEIYLND